MDDFSEKGLGAAFARRGFSPIMLGSVIRWVREGVRPGDFLTAVIRNNLHDAAVRADPDNLRLLKQWCLFWYNDTPSTCWGSPERMREWEMSGGLDSTRKG